MDQLIQDVRFALRTLGRSRGFTLVAILCLALGIGVNTSVFSIVHGVLFRELPFADAERIVAVWSTHERRGIEDGALAFGDLTELSGNAVFEAVAGLTERSFTITAGEVPERVQGSSITPNLFAMLGVQPQRGRLFRPEEAAAAGFEQVVLLSDGLWRTRFGADPTIVNRTVHINGRELVVVGVMPPDFKFPETEQLWVPLGARDVTNRTQRSVQVIAKLAPGMTIESARSRLAGLSHQWEQQHAETHRDWGLDVVRFRDSIVDRPAQRLMYVMLGAVAFVLLIACANVANLLLARAGDRYREIALRTALGAGRLRIVRQLLTESLLLAGAGGVLGALLAAWWVEALVRTIPEEMACWIRFDVDGTVLLYTMLISLGTGVLFGLVPALQATRVDLQSGLRESGRGTTASRVQNRFRNSLVVGEIALSLMLLVAAALMVQTFMALSAASPGFQTENMLSLRLTLAGDHYDAVAARAGFFQRAAERMSALPGVLGAAATSSIPADDGGWTRPVAAEGSGRSAAEALIATEIVATTGLFETLGLKLLAGRDFTVQEATDSMARVAIVGTRLAQRLWPNQDAIGRRMRVGDDQLLTVVGIAPDLQYEEFGEDTERQRLQYHVPYAQWGSRGMAFLVHTTGNPAAAIPGVRDALRQLDPTLAAHDIMTMPERRAFTTWPQRVFGKIFGSFGITAMLLALAGVYGVMAFNVTRRRREIGVRMALGARPADVLRLVVGGAARLSLLGVIIGTIGALALTRVLTGILFGVSPTDPLTLIVTPLLLAAAALTASYIPALRAARVDPTVTLRSD